MSKNTTISVAIGLVAVALAAGFYVKNRQSEPKSIESTEQVDAKGESRPLVSTPSNWEGQGSSDSSSADQAAAGEQSTDASGVTRDPKIRKLFEVSKAQIRLEAGKKNLERMVQDGFAQQLVDADDASTTEDLVKAFSNNFDSDKIYAEYQKLVAETMSQEEVEQLSQLFENPEVSNVVSVLNNEGSFSEEEMPKLMSFVENLDKNPIPEDRKAALEAYYQTSMADQAGRFTGILNAQFDGMKDPLEKAVAKLDPNDNSASAKDLREKLSQLNEIQTHVASSEGEMKAEMQTQGIKGLAYSTREIPTEELKRAVTLLNESGAYAKNQAALGKATSGATTNAMRAIGTELGKIDVARSEKRG